MSWAKLTVKDEDGYVGEVTAMARYGHANLVYTADRLYAWFQGGAMLTGFFLKDPKDGTYRDPSKFGEVDDSGKE